MHTKWLSPSISFCAFSEDEYFNMLLKFSLSFSLLQMMILLITRTHSSIKRTAASIALFCIKPKRIHAREQLMMMMMMMLLALEGGVAAAVAAVVVLVVVAVVVLVAVVAFAC